MCRSIFVGRSSLSSNFRDQSPVVGLKNCVVVAFVVVADEMQRSVHDEVGPVRAKRLALLARFATKHLRADDEIAQRHGRSHRRSGEREHVRRVILAAIVRVQLAAFGTADETDAHFAVRGTTAQRFAGTVPPLG